jgi:hypothetical protein
MARKPRLCVSDVIHHVTSEVIDSRVLFRDSADKDKFIDLLNKYLAETGFDLLGIVFYPQHYEMALRLNDRPMKDLFQRFHSAYARYYMRATIIKNIVLKVIFFREGLNLYRLRMVPMHNCSSLIFTPGLPEQEYTKLLKNWIITKTAPILQ